MFQNILNNKQKIIEGLLILNGATLLFPNKFKAFPIILLFLATIYYHFKTGDKTKFKYNFFLIVSIFFIINLLSLFYSNDFSYGLKKTETILSLPIYSLIIGMLHTQNFCISKILVNKILYSVLYSSIIFLLLSFAFFWLQEFSFTETIVHYFNLINIRLGYYSIHPIYLSIHIGISLIFIISKLFTLKSWRYRFFYCCLFLFLSLFLGILMRKGPILFLLVSIICFLIYKSNFKKTIIYSIIIIIPIGFSITFLPKYKNYNRLNEILIEKNYNDTNTSTGIRTTIYHCSTKLIKQMPIWGYGCGDVQNLLNICLEDKQVLSDNKTYNTHNQFVSVFLSTGWFGFGLFIVSVIFILKKILTNGHIYFAIICFISLNFLTENILERENGIILFAFLTNVFLYQKNQNIDL